MVLQKVISYYAMNYYCEFPDFFMLINVNTSPFGSRFIFLDTLHQKTFRGMFQFLVENGICLGKIDTNDSWEEHYIPLQLLTFKEDFVCTKTLSLEIKIFP